MTTPTESAQIIPFPSRKPVPENQSARLNRALQSLQAAVEDQKSAVADWQGAIADLRQSMERLGGHMRQFQMGLEDTQTELGGLRQESDKLNRWADGVVVV